MTIPESLTSVRPHKRIVDYLIIAYFKLKASVFILLKLRRAIEIRKLKKHHQGIQLKMVELIKVIQAINKFEPWFEKITLRFPELEAYPVSYPGNITQWRELMDAPEKLEMDLPPAITNQSWDVILVDGPRGNSLRANIPGRMSSIYMASKLVGESAYVFVHDAERTIESVYANKFLGAEQFVEEVRGRARLLIYRFS